MSDPSFIYDEKDRIDTELERREPPLPWAVYDEDTYLEPGSYVVWTLEGWLASYFDGWYFDEDVDADITHYLEITPPKEAIP